MGTWESSILASFLCKEAVNGGGGDEGVAREKRNYLTRRKKQGGKIVCMGIHIDIAET